MPSLLSKAPLRRFIFSYVLILLILSFLPLIYGDVIVSISRSSGIPQPRLSFCSRREFSGNVSWDAHF
ncbi:hypothetical protein K443DRAFT_153187 [Laccaria amethystina LaAM-08-1]|uniref:Unplaced genomic scaffold K443scaffold_10, whole genome shotgun sequence n=1 Tax=Laccaria amethystina LaAM-08-1 TaxID=1095629 RepID=A0A0C9XSB5_9AGAR|nr:hypothetical protein K443DRAFT_153187 [Laccaria amethystina LaAM-08-1]